MKAGIVLFSLCAALAEIAWCRPIEEGQQVSTVPDPPPVGEQQQEANVLNPGASVLLQKIIGDWKYIQQGLEPIGGADGLVNFLEEKKPEVVGSLLDAYEKALLQAKKGKDGGELVKPSDILKTISGSLGGIRRVCEECGGLGGLVESLNLLLEGKLDVADNAVRAARSAVSAQK